MDSPEPFEPDPFAPPAEPCECFCLHCQRVVMSTDIWFQPVIGAPDGPTGFWMCPTPNCSGAGFSFDLHPTDPDHPANSDWHSDDCDEDEFQPDEEFEYDPTEPQYPSADVGEDDDDIEGEEWKLGLQPGERPPESPEAAAARAEWEAQQRKYDEPDRRPRQIDGSHWRSRRQSGPVNSDAGSSDGVISDDDIPF